MQPTQAELRRKAKDDEIAFLQADSNSASDSVLGGRDLDQWQSPSAGSKLPWLASFVSAKSSELHAEAWALMLATDHGPGDRNVSGVVQ